MPHQDEQVRPAPYGGQQATMAQTVRGQSASTESGSRDARPHDVTGPSHGDRLVGDASPANHGAEDLALDDASGGEPGLKRRHRTVGRAGHCHDADLVGFPAPVAGDRRQRHDKPVRSAFEVLSPDAHPLGAVQRTFEACKDTTHLRVAAPAHRLRTPSWQSPNGCSATPRESVPSPEEWVRRPSCGSTGSLPHDERRSRRSGPVAPPRGGSRSPSSAMPMGLAGRSQRTSSRSASSRCRKRDSSLRSKRRDRASDRSVETRRPGQSYRSRPSESNRRVPARTARPSL